MKQILKYNSAELSYLMSKYMEGIALGVIAKNLHWSRRKVISVLVYLKRHGVYMERKKKEKRFGELYYIVFTPNSEIKQESKMKKKRELDLSKVKRREVPTEPKIKLPQMIDFNVYALRNGEVLTSQKSTRQ